MMKQKISLKLWLGMLTLLTLTGCTGSGDKWKFFDIEQMLRYFNTNSADPLITFTKLVAYILGVVFFVKALMKLKHYGDQRNMMSTQTEFGKAMLYFVAGLALVNIDQALNVLSMTVWGMNSQAVEQRAASYFSDPNIKRVVDSLGLIIKLIGLIAFVRGWILLAGAVTHQSQQGALPKALTHMIGGVLLFHFQAVAVLFASAFGLAK